MTAAYLEKLNDRQREAVEHRVGRADVMIGGPRRVAAASYEAWEFGVRLALPSVTAKRRCPDLIFVKPRFDVHRAVSTQIREIFAEHTGVTVSSFAEETADDAAQLQLEI